MNLYRQPDGDIIAIGEYRPSTAAERGHWAEIYNTERYQAWRAKRNRVNREPRPISMASEADLILPT